MTALQEAADDFIAEENIPVTGVSHARRMLLISSSVD
jgi:hypothetical protein